MIAEFMQRFSVSRAVEDLKGVQSFTFVDSDNLALI